MISLSRAAMAFAIAGSLSACSLMPKSGDPRLSVDTPAADGAEVIRDADTGLVWVNDIRFCFAGIVETDSDSCSTLNEAAVAGVTTWRMPTSAEMSGFIGAVVDDGEIQVNYINAACAVMTASDGWVFNENSSQPGVVSQSQPGNGGLRCVSEITQ